MNCIDCGVSMSDKALFRTAPKGVSPANWKCGDCLNGVPLSEARVPESREVRVLKAVGDIPSCP